MWTRTGVMAAAVSAAALILGCSQQPAQKAAATEEKDFNLSPAAVTVQAGIVTGELTQMKVTEEVKKGSGEIVLPPQLSGTLKLKNTSTDQTVHLLGGKIRYLDAQGQPIKVADSGDTAAISFAGYGSTDQLTPGQDTTQSVNVGFPAAALKAKDLKSISLELTYVPTPYKDETLNFKVAVSGQ